MPTPHFDLELLRTFVTIANADTFALAGRQLGRSQSGISHHMQRLEAQVGLPLFVKDGRAKRLTVHGEQLLRYARDILSLNDDAMRSLKATGEGGVLRLGSPHDVADALLPQMLNRIARSMPQLRIEVVVARSPQLMVQLHQGELDLALSTREDAALEGFAMRKSPTVWLCAAHFNIAAGRALPLILGDESSLFRRSAIDALERAQIPWTQVCSSGSPLGIKAALRAGLGITARSMEMVGPGVRLLGAEDGLPQLPEVTYHLWVRPHSLNPFAKEIFKLLREGNHA
ncbi:transcriptional regulator LrhA [Lampropedia puyangensis]|uniref:Transcriptional regulator LrhA n=1 Tax=Lampropedia puyangensis TaxID=1330072 RepID=A0A4S8FEG3_9BURK|nr:LysR substrate-binding domain-containing protein [Lampropedia puyangensis]THU05451.1 transcriptional regulator LrhA [Lampropedia puyangensis]